MRLRDVHTRILAELRHRISNGEISERACARLLAISQPHMNNVLKGRRTLSPELADTILIRFNLNVLDFATDCEMNARLSRPSSSRRLQVPVFKTPIGPGHRWTPTFGRTHRFMSLCLPLPLPRRAVLVRLGEDLQMSPSISENDVALIDTSAQARSAECPNSVFVVIQDGAALLRWIRFGANTMYIADDFSINRPVLWTPVPSGEAARSRIVKGRVVWMAKERLVAHATRRPPTIAETPRYRSRAVVGW